MGNTEMPMSQEIEQTTEKELKYVEIYVNSFTAAVDEIEKDGIFKNEAFNICLTDIDGVLFKDNLVKLPFGSHFAKPEISQRCKKAYNKLIRITDGKAVISTNRSENDTFVFNSKNVLKNVKELVSSHHTKVPIFTNLFKQVPGVTKEDISLISDENSTKWVDEKIPKPRIDALVHYLGKLATEEEYDSYNLTSIEDWSIVSLNREDFLKYIKSRLYEEYGIEIGSIRNYVIKR